MVNIPEYLVAFHALAFYTYLVQREHDDIDHAVVRDQDDGNLYVQLEEAMKPINVLPQAHQSYHV